jgi:hypothetical protein
MLRDAFVASLLVVALPGCSSTSRSASPNIGNAMSVTVPIPRLFAAFFEEQRTWRYDVEVSESHDNDGKPMTYEHHRVTCTVVEVRRAASLPASNIECDDTLGDSDPVAGIWATDGSGLWHLDDWPDAGVATLDPSTMFLAAAPKPYSEVRPEPGSEDYEQELSVEADGAGWCVTLSWSGGDGGGKSMCLDARGPVSGGNGWAGAESHDTTFELVE